VAASCSSRPHVSHRFNWQLLRARSRDTRHRWQARATVVPVGQFAFVEGCVTVIGWRSAPSWRSCRKDVKNRVPERTVQHASVDAVPSGMRLASHVRRGAVSRFVGKRRV